MLLVSFLAATAFTVGGILIGLALAYLIVAQVYKDAEKGPVYKPSTKAIMEEYERETYHQN
mgnify:CR=1 FL=1